MQTVIKKCTCKSEYQDEKYGKDMRVFNTGKKDHVCTSCGKKVLKDRV